MSPLALLLIMLGGLAVTAFLEGMETGIISIHRMRLKHFVRKGDVLARKLQSYLDEPDRLLGTTLLGTSVCIVMISVCAENLASRMPADWWSYVFNFCSGMVVLIFAEYLPKAWFHAKPFVRSRRFVRLLQGAEWVLSPVIRLLTLLTQRVLPGRDDVKALAPFVSREDLRMLMREGEEHGVLSTEERLRIQRVFDLRRRSVRDVMVPNAQMAVVGSDLSIAAFLDLERASLYTRMPVRNAQTGKLDAVINLFSAMSVPDESCATKTVAEVARKAMTVAETLPLDDVYVLMRRQRQPMALVINDRQDVVGLVTDEDVLEEIVGKLSWRHPAKR